MKMTPEIAFACFRRKKICRYIMYGIIWNALKFWTKCRRKGSNWVKFDFWPYLFTLSFPTEAFLFSHFFHKENSIFHWFSTSTVRSLYHPNLLTMDNFFISTFGVAASLVPTFEAYLSVLLDRYWPSLYLTNVIISLLTNEPLRNNIIDRIISRRTQDGLSRSSWLAQRIYVKQNDLHLGIFSSCVSVE